MPEFNSARSARVIQELVLPLKVVLLVAIKHIDFSLVQGARPLGEQVRLFDNGQSELDGITQISKHQVWTSEELPNGYTEARPKAWAVDILPAPYTLHGIKAYDDRPRFTQYAGFILGIGANMGIELRWGGDWNGDFSYHDQKFHDLPHLELVRYPDHLDNDLLALQV